MPPVETLFKQLLIWPKDYNLSDNTLNEFLFVAHKFLNKCYSEHII